MKKGNFKAQRRSKVKSRVRATVNGTAERPRLSVYKSNKNVYVQIIDDQAGATLASCKADRNLDKAKSAGEEIAKLAQDKGINNIVFDRSGYRYHGIIKAVAEGARDGGLQF